MAVGDAAAAAGFPLVDGATTDANTIDTEINRSRDLIAGTVPTNRGGTGSTNLYGVTAPSAGPNTGILVIKSNGQLARGSGALPIAYIPNIPPNKIQPALTGVPGNFEIAGECAIQGNLYLGGTIIHPALGELVALIGELRARIDRLERGAS